MYGSFLQEEKSVVDIWYVEEITDPYDNQGTVIQVTYKDRWLGDKVLLFKVNTLSLALKSGRYQLTYDTNDRLFSKDEAWILRQAVKLD